MKVIASSLRKGNVVERDNQLYIVLNAESFHPGKGTPTTQIDMRRISDGVKVTDRYKTTEQVERAFVEDQEFSYLQEGMKVLLSVFNGTPVAIQIPPRVTLEIVDTEPAMKGQTASSSYKPAMLSNGVKTSVPPHVQTGTRVVIQTEDGSYVERAKD